MNTELVQKWVERYPDLETFIGAGTISLKLARDILGVDRLFMYEIFKDLIQAGAVTACSGSSWRATKECQQWLAQRREARNENLHCS